ncbi:hypothetical protein A3860_35185 [Niastella vici]|uniref:Uncharacterized protein n=1 Tax=Niastella vici TaxID=1703345 RepID=A0A1V9FNY3_9BACT|nr:hypothetical protein [Niastella vici]OQP60017.1 hypothetical protein A3860_35185 [Niastella vici]
MQHIVFNIVLLSHFICFLGYVFSLATLWKTYNTQVRDKKSLILGILILVTGILLVVMKAPNINYFKVVPKTSMFAIVTAINIKFEKKPYSKTAYYALIGLTLAAACLAVWRM